MKEESTSENAQNAKENTQKEKESTMKTATQKKGKHDENEQEHAPAEETNHAERNAQAG